MDSSDEDGFLDQSLGQNKGDPDSTEVTPGMEASRLLEASSPGTGDYTTAGVEGFTTDDDTGDDMTTGDDTITGDDTTTGDGTAGASSSSSQGGTRAKSMI